MALIAAVYTQTLGKRGRGFVAGVGIVIVACAQIFFESARRDEVLKIDFLLRCDGLCRHCAAVRAHPQPAP